MRKRQNKRSLDERNFPKKMKKKENVSGMTFFLKKLKLKFRL